MQEKEEFFQQICILKQLGYQYYEKVEILWIKSYGKVLIHYILKTKHFLFIDDDILKTYELIWK